MFKNLIFVLCKTKMRFVNIKWSTTLLHWVVLRFNEIIHLKLLVWCLVSAKYSVKYASPMLIHGVFYDCVNRFLHPLSLPWNMGYVFLYEVYNYNCVVENSLSSSQENTVSMIVLSLTFCPIIVSKTLTDCIILGYSSFCLYNSRIRYTTTFPIVTWSLMFLG